MESRIRARMNPTGIKRLSSTALHPRGGCGPSSARIFTLYVQASLVSVRWFIVVSDVACPAMNAGTRLPLWAEPLSGSPVSLSSASVLTRRHSVVTELVQEARAVGGDSHPASGGHHAMSRAAKGSRQPP